jgi:hypothetical protein
MEEPAEIEGDFEQSKWSYIQIDVVACANVTDSPIVCKSPEIIKEAIGKSYFAIYY